MNPLGLLYLHGFLSSPTSTKARWLADWSAQQGIAYRCPALPIGPAEAIGVARQALDDLLAEGRSPCILGSSLGGLYTVHLMETHPESDGLRAIQLNPACHPARDLATQVGTHTAWNSDDVLEFTPAHVEEIRLLERSPTRLHRYLLIAAQGDEVLDWREMAAFYAGAQSIIVPGSDHGLTGFPELWPQALAFLQGQPGGPAARA